MRLVVWDSFTFLIRGEKLSPIVSAEAQRKGVENVAVHFGDGFMSIQGLVRKFIGIPFSIILSDPVTSGVSVSLRLESAAAFGFIPLPKLLLYIAEGYMEKEVVELDAESRRIRLSLVRFLPPFIDLRIESVRLVPAGILVDLGEGGADPPLPPGGLNGSV